MNQNNFSYPKLKCYSQKSIKVSFQNLSQTALENQENPKSIANLQQKRNISGQRQLIIGRISELGRAGKHLNQRNLVINEDNNQSQDQISKTQKTVYFDQTQASNQIQNISSQNDPEKMSHSQKLKQMFNDDGKTKFISNFFKRSQIRKLTESKKDVLQSISEREVIKSRLQKLKSKKCNYIDYSSDDQKRYLIEQIHTLSSPRFANSNTDRPNLQLNSSILSKQQQKLQQQHQQQSQSTLRYIDFQKTEGNENNQKHNLNLAMNGPRGYSSDTQKNKKFKINLNSHSFHNSQQQITNSNLQTSKSQINSSLIFKIDFGSCRDLLNTNQNSAKNNFNTNQNQTLQPIQNSTLSNNIHTRKEFQDPSKPIKMSIRFQNLFKNH